MPEEGSPVLCAACGNAWEHCQCTPESSYGRITAFYGQGNKPIKVAVVEDILFIEEVDQTVLFDKWDFKRMAEAWLSVCRDDDEETHQHRFNPSLDPHYALCACGETRLIPIPQEMPSS